MFEENNQGRGYNKSLIYAIAGVALLIVAVAGSAYAYFSASATSDAFTGTTLDVKLSKPTVTLKSGTGTQGAGLIPIHDGSVSGHNNQLTTATNSTNNCIDSNNYTVCRIYEISVSNDGSTDTTVDFQINLTSAPANVTWAKMTAVNTFGALKGTDNYLEKNVALVGNGNVKKYFVVYLKNTGADQTTADSGKNISGTVTVTASTGANIEATF